MIELKNISKTYKVAKRKKGVIATFHSLFKREYKYIKALDDVSFKINEGEIIGLLGPNGAGKSTAIKIMSGILVPNSGDCIINSSIPWKDRKEYVKDIGVVFGQRIQLWWDVPIIDSYELLKDIYEIPDDIYQETLEYLTTLLDMKEFLNTPLRQLSLGERMKSEIVAALLHNPKLLFLDEPTIGLDAVAKLTVRKFIKKINKEKKVTVILTTHDMNDVEALTDNIILIGKGKILYNGSMKKMKTNFDIYRNLTINFKEHKEKVEIKNTFLISWKNDSATYKVDIKKTSISDVLKKLNDKLEIIDMTSSEPPLEEIIALFYKENDL